MAHNKITRINKQVIPTDGVKTEFSDVDVAKSFYYTDNELALFDTWKNQIQWAIVNDDDSRPSWLKVTIDFANPGDITKWHSALDALQDELLAHRQSKHKPAVTDGAPIVDITLVDSDDHLF